VPSLLVVAAERDQVSFVKKVKDQLPELSVADEVSNIFILKIVTDRRTSSEVNESFIHEPAAELEVSSVQLGVRFLEDRHPQVVALALGENRLALWVARKVVVYSYYLPLAIFAELDSVAADVVDLPGDEKSLNQCRAFCEDRKR